MAQMLREMEVMRRILLLHTYGPLAGLVQIWGIYPDGEPILPVLSDAAGGAVLAKVEPRYVLYRAQPLSGDGAPAPSRD